MFGAPPPTPPHQPSGGDVNTLATLSVVFAFLFAPAGAVLGHLGLRQITRTGERGRERALIGIGLSYTIIVVSVVVLVVWTVAGRGVAPGPVASPSATTTAATGTTSAQPSPPPPPAAPTVDAAGLPAVLVPLLDLRNLTGDQGQQPLDTSETVEPPPSDGGTFSDDSCLAAFVGGTPNAFDGTNWRKFYGSDSVNQQTGLQIGQAAALFDDAAAAQKALTGYLDKWRACSGKTTGWTLPNGQKSTITYGTPQDMGNGITVLNNTVSGLSAPLVFARVLAVKNNVLLDNGVSGLNVGDMPTKLTQAMLGRIKS
jgi:hypothetical protein